MTDANLWIKTTENKLFLRPAKTKGPALHFHNRQTNVSGYKGSIRISRNISLTSLCDRLRLVSLSSALLFLGFVAHPILAMAFGNQYENAQQPKPTQHCQNTACQIINSEHQSDDQLKTEINQLLNSAIDRLGAPASWSIAISKNGRTVFAGAAGLMDKENKEKATPETVYRSYSISKAITAVAVMQLVEQEVVSLNDDIRKYVPQFPKKRRPVKIIHLLTHTSGIRHYKPDAGEISSTVEYDSLADSLSVFADDPLSFEPGTQLQYTSFGFNLLTGVVESASGMSFEAYLDKHIFKPANMKNSGLDVAGREIKNMATGYWLPRHRGEPYWPVRELPNVSGRYGSSGVVSTPLDLVKFLNAIESEKLLTKATRKQMWSPGVPEISKQLGLGWQLSELRTGPNPEDISPVIASQGASSGFTAFMVYLPELNVSGAIMGNSQSEHRKEILLNAIKIVCKHADRSK